MHLAEMVREIVNKRDIRGEIMDEREKVKVR